MHTVGKMSVSESRVWVMIGSFSYLFIFEFVSSGLTLLENAERAVGYYSLVLLDDNKKWNCIIFLCLLESAWSHSVMIGSLKESKRMSSYYYESCKQKKTIITIHSCLKQQTKKHQSTVMEFTQQTYNRLTTWRCAVNKALFSPVVVSHYTLSVFGCALVTLVVKVLDNLLLCGYYILPVATRHFSRPRSPQYAKTGDSSTWCYI